METPEFTLPSWLHDQDAETIHKRMMAELPADIDDTEGGFPWDFTKPTALEKAELLEFFLPETLKIMFPQWAYDQWLDRHAEAAGTSRKPANPAYGILEITGTPGLEIPAGFRFAVPSSGDTSAIEFEAEETVYLGEDGTARVGVVAVEAGTAGNVSACTISIMANPIKGITGITNPEKTSGGTAEEDDEALRERIMEIYRTSDASFVGCDNDYIRWAKEVNGVGDVFVMAQWDANVKNSVKVVVMDANGEPANQHILDSVYDYIMSPDNRIERKAPIGAIVTVAAPNLKEITYTLKAVLNSGYEASTVVSDLKASIQEYYATAKEDGLIRYNKIHAIITQNPGINDFTELMINGRMGNVALEQDEYPGTVSIDLGIPTEVSE